MRAAFVDKLTQLLQLVQSLRNELLSTHSSKSGALNKEPWVFTEEYTNVIRQTVRQRYDMAPYIYAMARKGYDEGLALCRPLYYDWPEAPEAYDMKFRSR